MSDSPFQLHPNPKVMMGQHAIATQLCLVGDTSEFQPCLKGTNTESCDSPVLGSYPKHRGLGFAGRVLESSASTALGASYDVEAGLPG